MNKKSPLLIIFLTVFIDLLGFGVLIPLLPTFASTRLDISDFQIGIVVAVFSLMQFLFNPLLGRLSDKFGRRPFILYSLLLTGFSYILFSFSDNFFLLLLSRILGGLGGSNIGVAQAYIADITPKQERSKGMGLIGAAFGLGFIFGPVIGGAVSTLKSVELLGFEIDGYAMAGFVSAGFSFVAAFFAFFYLPESLHARKTESRRSSKLFDFRFTKSVLTHADIGILVLIFFIIVFSISNIYGTFALLGHSIYGFTDQQNGYLFGIMGITSVIIQGVFIKSITSKFKEKPLLVFGTFCLMVGLAGFPFGINFMGLAVISVLFSIGTAVLQPTILSMISGLAPESEQGAILGVNQSLSSFARVLGPLWGGFSYEIFGYQFPFLTGALFTFITMILVLFFKDKKKEIPAAG